MQSSIKRSTEFSTDNLNLAAWLWHSGFLPEAVPTADPRKVNFRFVSSAELDEAVVVFLRGEARIFDD